VTGALIHSRSVTFHPAVWIAGWAVVALFLQGIELRWLAVLAAPTFFLVLVFAAGDALRMARRARWLLLAIAVLFIVSTPGERLPGIAGSFGLTRDGFSLAAEHVLRLLLLLTTLAWLLKGLRTEGLLAGLHCLMRPFGAARDRLVVRLQLALEYAEQENTSGNWRAWLGSDGSGDDQRRHVRLELARLRLADRIALATCGVAALLAVLK